MVFLGLLTVRSECTDFPLGELPAQGQCSTFTQSPSVKAVGDLEGARARFWAPLGVAAAAVLAVIKAILQHEGHIQNPRISPDTFKKQRAEHVLRPMTSFCVSTG